jgi:hypothetical protein
MVINKTYNTVWQKKKNVKYKLLSIHGNRVKLVSIFGGKEFFANINDLIHDN